MCWCTFNLSYTYLALPFTSPFYSLSTFASFLLLLRFSFLSLSLVLMPRPFFPSFHHFLVPLLSFHLISPLPFLYFPLLLSLTLPLPHPIPLRLPTLKTCSCLSNGQLAYSINVPPSPLTFMGLWTLCLPPLHYYHSELICPSRKEQCEGYVCSGLCINSSIYGYAHMYLSKLCLYGPRGFRFEWDGKKRDNSGKVMFLVLVLSH